MGFEKKGPDGECADGKDPPLYPERKEIRPVPVEELRGLIKKPSERRPK